MTLPTNETPDTGELSEDRSMLDCKHPLQNVSGCFEFGERYDKCQLCGHIMTSKIINDARKEELEALLSVHSDKRVGVIRARLQELATQNKDTNGDKDK